MPRCQAKRRFKNQRAKSKIAIQNVKLPQEEKSKTRNFGVFAFRRTPGQAEVVDPASAGLDTPENLFSFVRVAAASGLGAKP